MEALIFSALFAPIILGLVLLARVLDRRITLAAAVGCTIYLALDDLVTGLPHLAPALDLFPGAWNWTGKLLSIALAVAVIFLLRIPRLALGLRIPVNEQGLVLGGLLGFAVWGLVLGHLFKPGVPDTETLLFQGTMPGLAEELAYRGIAPAILLGPFLRRSHPEEIPWVIILLTALLFGLWHALQVSGGRFHFDPMSGLFPLLGSIPGGYMRFRTNSLWVPMACHGAANLTFHVTGGLL